MRPTRSLGGRQQADGRRCGDPKDRGSTSLELVIVFPAVLLILFGIIQGAVYYYARSAALAAAQEGSRAAGAETGTASMGQQAASSFVYRVAGRQLLQVPQVSASRTPTTVTVTVTGKSLSLLPGFKGWTITQTASVPVERITGGVGP